MYRNGFYVLITTLSFAATLPLRAYGDGDQTDVADYANGRKVAYGNLFPLSRDFLHDVGPVPASRFGSLEVPTNGHYLPLTPRITKMLAQIDKTTSPVRKMVLMRRVLMLMTRGICSLEQTTPQQRQQLRQELRTIQFVAEKFNAYAGTDTSPLRVYARNIHAKLSPVVPGYNATNNVHVYRYPFAVKGEIGTAQLSNPEQEAYRRFTMVGDMAAILSNELRNFTGALSGIVSTNLSGADGQELGDWRPHMIQAVQSLIKGGRFALSYHYLGAAKFWQSQIYRSRPSPDPVGYFSGIGEQFHQQMGATPIKEAATDWLLRPRPGDTTQITTGIGVPADRGQQHPGDVDPQRNSTASQRLEQDPNIAAVSASNTSSRPTLLGSRWLSQRGGSQRIMTAAFSVFGNNTIVSNTHAGETTQFADLSGDNKQAVDTRSVTEARSTSDVTANQRGQWSMGRRTAWLGRRGARR